MPKDHQKDVLKLAQKAIFAVGALFLALGLGPVLGTALLFYYAYLLLTNHQKLQQVFDRVGESNFLVRAWDWLKAYTAQATISKS